DGGGLLALSELYMVKEILTRLQFDLHLPSIPLTCDVFDVVGGSGTGGIIALLLGRLRLSVDDAIECFIIISRILHKYGDSATGRKARGFTHNHGETSTSLHFESPLASFRDSFSHILPLHSFDESLIEVNPPCRTFVCAMPLAAIRNSTLPTCFRIFRSRQYRSHDCTIREAACATTAYIGFFPPVQIGPPSHAQRFVDAGFSYNNPVEVVIRETECAFPSIRYQTAVVSIGAGHPGVEGSSSHLDPWTSLLYEIGRDCEKTAERIASTRDSNYFRYNVSQGFQGIGLADWVDPGYILTHAESYAAGSAVNESLNRLVDFLVKRHRKLQGRYLLALLLVFFKISFPEPKHSSVLDPRIEHLLNSQPEVNFFDFELMDEIVTRPGYSFHNGRIISNNRRVLVQRFDGERASEVSSYSLVSFPACLAKGN
ncbi:acyl transferase/acyl hydrolase/lysophospholipase, partial [Flagelloscypha sp. PMI_526]